MKSGYIIVILLSVLSLSMLISYVYEEKTEYEADTTHTTGDLLIEFEPRIPNESQIIYSEGNGSVTIDFRRQE